MRICASPEGWFAGATVEVHDDRFRFAATVPAG